MIVSEKVSKFTGDRTSQKLRMAASNLSQFVYSTLLALQAFMKRKDFLGNKLKPSLQRYIPSGCFVGDIAGTSGQIT